MLVNVADPGKSAINSEHHVISYCLKMAVEGDKLMQKTCKWPKNWNNNFKTAESLSVSALRRANEWESMWIRIHSPGWM